MHMRIAELGDADTLTALINAAFRVEKFFVDGDRITLGQVQAYLAKGEFLVLEDADGIAACVYLENRGDRSYLGLLSVDPKRQRAGLGSRLVAAAEDCCRRSNCRFVDLNIVNVRQELPGFYQKLGYIPDGTSPFPAEVETKLPCHFVKMWKAL